jgi:predicted CXXCH cytochrome family protein
MHHARPAVLALVLIAAAGGCSREAPPVIGAGLRTLSAHPAAGAAACAACHPAAFNEWVESQHAAANRLVSDALDGPAFEPGRSLEHGSFVTRMAVGGKDRFLFTTMTSNLVRETHRAEAVIGISPLRQYLVPFPGGRLQAMDVAYDPRSNEWFNVFGEENRQPGEWGHWTGRGMTWNVQCAFCHMTGFQKNYDPVADAYASSWKAMGISCAQCHAQVRPATRDQCAVTGGTAVASAGRRMDTCASCHARREELFGTFKPGDAFHDHYRLALPDQPGVFYADGQVREEDFEYASFLMSRMGHKGVTCMDCHRPHSGKLVASADNNALCMRCHAAPGANGAIPIDPTAHSFHQPASPGNRCVECHMPVSTFMARDGRRDHGFTVPDPLLTIEHGIPNACNRCHTDRTR